MRCVDGVGAIVWAGMPAEAEDALRAPAHRALIRRPGAGRRPAVVAAGGGGSRSVHFISRCALHLDLGDLRHRVDRRRYAGGVFDVRTGDHPVADSDRRPGLHVDLDHPGRGNRAQHLAAGAADASGGIECAKPRRRGPLYADRSEADAGVRAHRRRHPRGSVVAGVRADGALARPVPFGVGVQQCRLRAVERQPDAVARRRHGESRDYAADHCGRTGVLRDRRAARPAAPTAAAVAAHRASC